MRQPCGWRQIADNRSCKVLQECGQVSDAVGRTGASTYGPQHQHDVERESEMRYRSQYNVHDCQRVGELWMSTRHGYNLRPGRWAVKTVSLPETVTFRVMLTNSRTISRSGNWNKETMHKLMMSNLVSSISWRMCWME
jgi:hypothetical protein